MVAYAWTVRPKGRGPVQRLWTISGESLVLANAGVFLEVTAIAITEVQVEFFCYQIGFLSIFSSHYDRQSFALWEGLI